VPSQALNAEEAESSPSSSLAHAELKQEDASSSQAVRASVDASNVHVGGRREPRSTGDDNRVVAWNPAVSPADVSAAYSQELAFQEDEVDEVGPLCSWERMTRSVDLAHSLRKLQHSSMEVTKQKCVASWRSISTDDTWQRRRRKPPVHKQLAFVNAGTGGNSNSVRVPRIYKSEHVRALTRSAMRSTKLFDFLDEASIEAIIDSMSLMRVEPGELVMEQGTAGDNWYVMESGTAQVHMRLDPEPTSERMSEPARERRLSVQAEVQRLPPGPLGVLLPVLITAGQGFGELALLYSSPRSASVQAATACTLWVMERKYYSCIKRRYAQTVHREKRALFDSVPLFMAMNRRQLDLLAEALERVEFRRGQCIMKKGCTTRVFHIITKGQVAVELDGAQERILEEGQYFGEEFLVPETACARNFVAAADQVQCWRLTLEAFQSILGSLEDMWRMEALRCVPELSVVSEKQLVCLAHNMENFTMGAGEFLYREGDVSDCLVLVTPLGPETSSLDQPHLPFHGLMENRVCTTSYAFDQEVRVCKLTRAAVEQCLGSLKDVRRDWRAERLRRAEHLQLCTPRQRRWMAARMTARRFASGETILEPGSSPEDVFVVERGRVVVFDADGLVHKSHFFGKGDVFGKCTFSGDEISKQGARAEGEVEVLALHRNVVDEAIKPVRAAAASQGAAKDQQWEGEGQPHLTLGQLKEEAVLGMGTFGKVVLVLDTKSANRYALKCISKQRILQSNMIHHLREERRIMQDLRACPFLVDLVQTLQDEKNVYLAMEPIMGGELFMQMCNGCLSEEAARFYAACVVQTLDHIHSHGYIYRDLKPENLMLDTSGYLKLTDFGFAKRLVDARTYTMCGTPDYLAPEVLMEAGHQHSVDWWALGVLIFEMTTLRRPFTVDDPMETVENILAVRVDWEPAWECGLSSECQDLIQQLLTANSAMRLGNLKEGANDIRRHPWFSSFDWEALQTRKMPAPVVPALQNSSDTQFFEDFPLDTPVPGEDEQWCGENVYDSSIFSDW